MGVRLGPVSWGNGLAFPGGADGAREPRSSSSALSRETLLHKSVMVQIQDVHSNAIHNGPKLEMPQLSINSQMNRSTLLTQHSEMPHSKGS